MLVQVDILHKTDAHYVMDYDMRLPNRGKLCQQIVQCTTQPGKSDSTRHQNDSGVLWSQNSYWVKEKDHARRRKERD